MEGDHLESLDQKYWEKRATLQLKSDIDKSGISIKELADRLQEQGETKDYQYLRNVLSKGRISLPYYLKCLKALDLNLITMTRDQFI